MLVKRCGGLWSNFNWLQVVLVATDVTHKPLIDLPASLLTSANAHRRPTGLSPSITVAIQHQCACTAAYPVAFFV